MDQDEKYVAHFHACSSVQTLQATAYFVFQQAMLCRAGGTSSHGQSAGRPLKIELRNGVMPGRGARYRVHQPMDASGAGQVLPGLACSRTDLAVCTGTACHGHQLLHRQHLRTNLLVLDIHQHL